MNFVHRNPEMEQSGMNFVQRNPQIEQSGMNFVHPKPQMEQSGINSQLSTWRIVGRGSSRSGNRELKVTGTTTVSGNLNGVQRIMDINSIALVLEWNLESLTTDYEV